MQQKSWRIVDREMGQMRRGASIFIWGLLHWVVVDNCLFHFLRTWQFPNFTHNDYVLELLIFQIFIFKI